MGPEGCLMTSSVDPGVQVSFPPGALQKKIRVGLQVQTVDPSLVAACLGSPRIAFSPIVTIEPRRRKFHRPITVSIPLPGLQAQQHQQKVDLSTLRLLCSITGGTAPAIWEDITGSSPFSIQQQKGCVSFTTTVSARSVVWWVWGLGVCLSVIGPSKHLPNHEIGNIMGVIEERGFKAQSI